MFEVSIPINWLDAQSSCAIWGGDLTSITTHRENNYLNTLITSSVGDCWIGLNDRSTEGTYTWIDSTELDYTNWKSSMSYNSRGFCVQINNIDNGYWYSVNCEETSNTFVCKRPSNIPITGLFDENEPQLRICKPLNIRLNMRSCTCVFPKSIQFDYFHAFLTVII